MSIATGANSIKRLQVLTPNNSVSYKWIVSRLSHGLVKPLAMDATLEESFGFCNPFSGEPKFKQAESLVFDNAFLFAFRLDRKSISSTLLKLSLKAALRSLGYRDDEESMSLGGSQKKLSKKYKEKKDAIKEKIKFELLKSALPSVKIIEVLWFLDSNEVWFFSSSNAVFGYFETIFYKVFQLDYFVKNSPLSAIPFEKVLKKARFDFEPYMEARPVGFLKKNQSHQDELSY